MSKNCNGCYLDKSLDEFDKGAYICKECRKLRRAELNYERTTLIKSKICPSCGIDKLIKEYNSDSKNQDGLQCSCRKCVSERNLKASEKFDNFIKLLLKDCKTNAEKRKINFDICFDDMLKLYNNQEGKCVYTRKDFTFIKVSDKIDDNIYNLSIDRIDSTKDYTPDNIQLVGVAVNHMKYDMTNEEFLNYCELIYDNCINQS